ncbi:MULTISPECIES: D-2-hydroxyacid dehydrogenase [unclassified Roseovarius]|uniref:D-2-hydroxyacid dehydrogenase n=1 Tax=unclassified Roseovarius TaxID=2614913 RepID=UPI00273DF362|nr:MULTISPECIES: D-2-hydroxyacid dehydrogenase [unclassified Roseovarius]
MTRILIHNSKTDEMAARLADALPGVEAVTCETYDSLPERIRDFRPDAVYSICFNGRAGFPRDALLGDGGPKWISVGGSGVDHLAGWDPDAVTVTNSAGVAAPMMAEYVFGSILHFTLDIPGLQADQAEREWRSARLMSPLRGKTMLIVGLGHTGQEVAARAKAFGLTVIGTRARPEPMENVDEVHASSDLQNLWHRADFIVLSVPLLPTTRHMVNARSFAAMKPTAILVNVSRGGVMDDAALINAMRTKTIAAAALDVFEAEPLPFDDHMWGLENVILSPHCSAVYADWAMQSFELFIENLRRWQAGEPLKNIVNPERGY